jgi:predicted Na+-dependent transporter
VDLNPFEARTNNSPEWPGSEWWLLGSYEVVVKRPANWIEPWLDYLVIIFIGMNMLGVGGQIDAEEVLYLVKKPAAVSVGMLCRFGVMPAVSINIHL